jgi:hypothetical protein
LIKKIKYNKKKVYDQYLYDDELRLKALLKHAKKINKALSFFRKVINLSATIITIIAILLLCYGLFIVYFYSEDSAARDLLPWAINKVFNSETRVEGIFSSLFLLLILGALIFFILDLLGGIFGIFKNDNKINEDVMRLIDNICEIYLINKQLKGKTFLKFKKTRIYRKLSKNIFNDALIEDYTKRKAEKYFYDIF